MAPFWKVACEVKMAVHTKFVPSFFCVSFVRNTFKIASNPRIVVRLEGSLASNTSIFRCAFMRLFSGDSRIPHKYLPNGYIYFSCEKRPEVVQQYPDEGTVDIAKRLGQMWRDLDDDEKKEYSRKCQEHKATFNEDELRKLQEARRLKRQAKMDRKKRSEQIGDLRQRRQEFKEAGMPKRPPHAYMLFFSESGVSMRECAKRWAVLSDEEKKVYRDKAFALSEEYKHAMENWLHSLMQEGRFDILEKLKRQKRVAKKLSEE